MKTICFYFEIHQIIHLKRYRFFEIGTDHYYYDDYANETAINEVAERSYIPALNTLIEMVNKSNGAFKVALSVSGVALEQLEIHAPAVLDLLHQLNDTGCCEFLCEPYSHGLSSIGNEDCFKEEVLRQSEKINMLFGKKPKVFRNSSLIYSDEIGALVAGMGFKGMLTEGAKHILGWKSPHYVYHCNQAPALKILLRDYKLSDDISLRFSNSEWIEYPLFADKYMNWISNLPEEEQVINIFMELSALGIAQPLSSNILEFMKALPACAKERGITFSTPTEIITKLKSVSQIDVPYPISWVDEERDLSAWLGNILQKEAFNKLYSVAERVYMTNDKRIKQDWDYLQASNNFQFMKTKDTSISIYRGIYDSPYDAFTNYMNILGDFIKRVNALYPEGLEDEELNSLLLTIKNQDEELDCLHKEFEKLQAKVNKAKEAKPKTKAATKKKEEN
ncbi:glycoside hydrolase family 57 protein [Bacteroides sp. OttesenSCG-928-E20]|nr:glycoside hydrolase family 57 protein [Bacteroides sp. OttesenSCG-928-N06]MDL2299139.1 glycoside hydrolase family 57 protein [Bacteroides sp. OttesenSCG-928-E20]